MKLRLDYIQSSIENSFDKKPKHVLTNKLQKVIKAQMRKQNQSDSDILNIEEPDYIKEELDNY